MCDGDDPRRLDPMSEEGGGGIVNRGERRLGTAGGWSWAAENLEDSMEGIRKG